MADVLKTLRFNNKKWFALTDRLITQWQNTGEVIISPTSMECWNYPTEENDWGAKEDNSTQVYNVMGHNSVDITAHRSADIMDIVRRIKSIPECYREGLFESFRDLKHFIFNKEASNWVWVVDSMSVSLKSESEEMAEDLLAVERGFKDSIDMFSKTNTLIPRTEIASLANKLILDKQSVHQSLVKRNNLVQVSPYMWVNKTDPTCAIVDDKHFKFDMRDGWSDKYLCELVSYWFLVFYQVNVKVSLKSDS